MPINDWQFWIVTIVALAALAVFVRMLIPKKKGKKTSLTVGGQPMGKRKKSAGKDRDCNCR